MWFIEHICSLNYRDSMCGRIMAWGNDVADIPTIIETIRRREIIASDGMASEESKLVRTDENKELLSTVNYHDPRWVVHELPEFPGMTNYIDDQYLKPLSVWKYVEVLKEE